MRIILVLGAVLAGCTSAVAPALPDGKNRVVDIVNTADTPLQFTAFNAEQRGLIRQPSAEGVVDANYYLTVNFADGSGACFYNLRADFADGQSAEVAQFNACTEVSWVVSP